jgi:GST-like protein
MIELHYWPTPNGHKVTLFLEETGTPYEVVPVNINKGEQFRPEFLKIAPNNRMPAIVDHNPADGGGSISIFESGAILQYLAEKTEKFLPSDVRGRAETMQWLFWQMGGLGPMAGQNSHFKNYTTDMPYPLKRYVDETARLFAVLDKRLQDREFVAGDYSIADMACYPWTVLHEMLGQDLDLFPSLKRWHQAIKSRPASQRAYALADKVKKIAPPVSDEERRQNMFGQNASTVRR